MIPVLLGGFVVLILAGWAWRRLRAGQGRSPQPGETRATMGRTELASENAASELPRGGGSSVVVPLPLPVDQNLEVAATSLPIATAAELPAAQTGVAGASSNPEYPIASIAAPDPAFELREDPRDVAPAGGENDTPVAEVYPAHLPPARFEEQVAPSPTQAPNHPSVTTPSEVPVERPSHLASTAPPVAVETPRQKLNGESAAIEVVAPPHAAEPPQAPAARKVPKYRAPVPKIRKPKPPAHRTPRVPTSNSRLRLETKVMARIDRAGRFDFTFLFTRPAQSPEQLEIEFDGGRMIIQARDGDWYEAPRLSSLGRALRNGFVATTASEQEVEATWVLSSGRDLFIFSHDGKLGWTNQPRLRLSLPQIVLCHTSLRDTVTRILAEACGVSLAEAPGGGAPEGWHVFGLLNPKNVLPVVADEDVLNLIRPSPEIEISLDGGLWLRANEWLAGFPPEIRIVGQLPSSETVLIDQIGATQNESGSFATPGCSTPGFHSVACAGRTASYTIADAPQAWDQPASFRSSRGAVTGAWAQPEGGPGHTLVTTPMTHRILVGPKPGDWFACSLRGGDAWRGLVPFDPVWALPADPLHCDRERTAIKLCRNQRVSSRAPGEKSFVKRDLTAVNRWCTAILDCRRKGLKLEQAEFSDLWAGYLAEARRLRRILRHDGRQ